MQLGKVRLGQRRQVGVLGVLGLGDRGGLKTAARPLRSPEGTLRRIPPRTPGALRVLLLTPPTL